MWRNACKGKPLKCALVALGGVLIWLLVANADFMAMWECMQEIPASTLLLLVGLQIFTQLLLGYQWHGIAKDVLGDSRFSHMLYIVCTGNIVEAITPGAKVGGEVTRLLYIKSECGCSTDKATNIILIQKSISMSVLMSICLASLLFISGIVSQGISIMAQGLIVTCSVLLVVFMMVFLFQAKKLASLLDNYSHRWIVACNKWVHSYANSTGLISKKHWYIQFFLSLIVWVLFPIKMAILCQSVGIELSFMLIIAITMTAYMMGMLPITPGGIGTFEGTMMGLLGIVGVSASVGMTMAIVFRVITFWFVIAVSTLFVIVYRKKGKHGCI